MAGPYSLTRASVKLAHLYSVGSNTPVNFQVPYIRVRHNKQSSTPDFASSNDVGLKFAVLIIPYALSQVCLMVDSTPAWHAEGRESPATGAQSRYLR